MGDATGHAEVDEVEEVEEVGEEDEDMQDAPHAQDAQDAHQVQAREELARNYSGMMRVDVTTSQAGYSSDRASLEKPSPPQLVADPRWERDSNCACG